MDIGQYTEELNEYLDAIETKTGVTIEDGYSRDQGVRSMRISLDPVAMLHRPLLWYFVRACHQSFNLEWLDNISQIIAVVDTYTSVLLLSMGFKHFIPSDPQWSRSFPPRLVLFFLSRRAPEGVIFPYWHRAHDSNTKLPLVFLHGIGVSYRKSHYAHWLSIFFSDRVISLCSIPQKHYQRRPRCWHPFTRVYGNLFAHHTSFCSATFSHSRQPQYLTRVIVQD